MSTPGRREGDGDVSLTVLPQRGRGRITRTRMGLRRAIVLGLVHVVIVVHVIHWLVAGRTLTPVEPSESMQLVGEGVLNAGLIFFALALLSTIVFGRFFCGWGCHVVALQDLCSWMLAKVGIRPKPFRSRLLLYVPLVLALYMFVWPAVYRFGLVPLSQSLHARASWVPRLEAPAWTGVRVELFTEGFWDTFPGLFVAIAFLFTIGFAIVYFLGAKGFCTYGCPYGGFFAPLDRYAPGRIRVNEDCTQSGHCTAVCSSNVRVHEEVAAYGMVVDPGCMKCMDCVTACPNEALRFGFGRPAVNAKPKADRAPSARWDLSWPEEIVLVLVFAAAFFALRGVYDLIPMLMAAGLAGIVTFVAWKAWRTLRDRNASFHRLRLRYHGRLTRGGVGFLAATALVFLLVAHSGAVRIVTARAVAIDEQVTVPRAYVYTPTPRVIPQPMLEDAAEADRLYALAGPFWRGGIGLAPWRGHDVRRAWLAAVRRDLERAETLLLQHADDFGPHDLLVRDVSLVRRVRLDDAAADAYALAMLDEHPAYVQTADHVAMAWVGDGRADEAIELVRDMIRRNEDHRPRRLMMLRRLSLLLAGTGRYDEAIEVFRETLEIDPANPAGWALLGRTCGQAGRFDEGLEATDRAIELRPDEPGFHDQRAELLAMTGRTMEAGMARDEAARLREAAADEAGATP